MVNFVSNSKEFGFSRVHIGYIVDRFSNDFLTSMNIRDQDNYIVFNIHI